MLPGLVLIDTDRIIGEMAAAEFTVPCEENVMDAQEGKPQNIKIQRKTEKVDSVSGDVNS